MPHIIWGRCLKQTKLRIQTGNETVTHDSCGVWHYNNAIIGYFRYWFVLNCTSRISVIWRSIIFALSNHQIRNYFQQVLVLELTRIRRTLTSVSDSRYETHECTENNFWVDRDIIELYTMCSLRHVVCVRYVLRDLALWNGFGGSFWYRETEKNIHERRKVVEHIKTFLFVSPRSTARE